MKKLVMMLVCMFAVHTMVMADNDKPIEVSQLPAKAQTFIKTYFKDHKVAMAKLESGMFYKSYDVVFTNGEKVEFDNRENGRRYDADKVKFLHRLYRKRYVTM